MDMDNWQNGEITMIAKKRTSLSAVLGSEIASSQEALAPTISTQETNVTVHKSVSRRPGIKQQTVYLPEAVYEQLRKLAFDERRRMHDYLMEGLDRVFKNRGLRSIKELTDENL
jgi:hypothetical protein